MYLLDDTISYFTTSWDLDKRGGEIKCLPEAGAFYFSMKNTNGKYPLSMRRTLTVCRDGEFIFETALNLNREVSGFSICLSDENDIPFLTIGTEGSGMYLNSTYLDEYEKDTTKRIKLKFNLDTKCATILLDGKTAGSVTIESDTIKYITITAPKLIYHEARLYFMRIYSEYDLNENFAMYPCGSEPLDNWNTEGRVFVKKIESGLSVPYDHSVYMEKKSRLFCDIPKHNKTVVEFTTLAEDFSVNVGEINVKADSKGIYAEDVRVGDNSLAYWSAFRFEFDGDKVIFKLNGRERTKIKASVPQRLEFMAGGDMLLDNVIVLEKKPEPKDYVPEPKPVKRDDIHVGMMACSIWHEGSHFGWDKINPFPERVPYNGFYDEGEIEQADWEIKYMCEHGIEYEIFCWYAPRGWVKGPIQPRTPAIHNALFNAKYLSDLKFSFMWENGASQASIDGFYDNLVPFWIEYYFKHPQFLVVDNKPVIYVYTHWGLRDHFGSSAEVKKAFEFLDSECKKAGFDGVTVILSLPQRIKAAFEEIHDMGIKHVFSYTWSVDASIDQQRNVINRQYDYNIADIVPTVSMGYDTMPWLGNSNGYHIPTEKMSELMHWVTDEHLKRYSSDCIASKMIVLDNWNEYGEGHYFMPTPMTGFRYLDAVLDGLRLEHEHNDVLPDENQKKRICCMYNQNRVVYKTGYIAPKHSENIVAGWYFGKDSDIGLWTPNVGISNLRKEEDAVCGHTESDGSFEIDLKEPIAIDNAGNIRVTIYLENHTFDQFKVMYKTEENPEYCDVNCTVGYAYENFPRGWILPVSRSDGWRGRITGLKIIPNTTGGDFKLVSIEILENERYLPQLKVNDKRIRLNYADGDLIAISDDILKSLNMAMSVSDSGIVTLKSNSGQEIVLTSDSNKAVVNGKEKQLSKKCEVVDRFFMLPYVEVCDILGYNTMYEGGIFTTNY